MEQLRKSTFKRGWQWLIWSGVLASVSIGGILIYGIVQNRPPAAVTVRVLSVEQGNVEDKIEESGLVELANQQTLKAPAENTVDQVLVQPGSQVVAGQELLILRNPEQQTSLEKKKLEIQTQELKVARAQQQISTAQDKLTVAQDKLQAFIDRQTSEQLEIRKQELAIANSRQRVRETEAKLQAALKELESVRELENRGLVAATELRSEEETVRNIQAELRQAQFDANNALVDLQTLQIKLPDSRQDLLDKVQVAQNELQQAQLDFDTNTRDLQRQQLEYQESEQKLLNNIVVSPIDGIILGLKVNPGDGVKIGDELLTLGDPSEELVKLQLSTLNASRVKPNQEARIAVIGPNPQQFDGSVESLSLQALTSESSSGSPFRQQSQLAVPAIIKLDRPTGVLIPGSQVSVEVILEQKENVVVLPNEAIQRQGKAAFVWVEDAEKLAQKREVTLGLEGISEVEIKTGLKEGDRVIVPSSEQPLTPGTPVIVTEEPTPDRARRRRS